MQLSLPFPRDGTAPQQKLRRRVYRLELQPLPDGSYLFKAKSFSRQNGVVYRCRVNPLTGYVWCSCRDFKYRKDRFEPNYFEGPFCKHLKRAVRTVKKLQKQSRSKAYVA